MNDSPEYLKRKKFFDSLITLYGRNVVLEVLSDENIQIHKLHLANSNQEDGDIKSIRSIAKKRNIEIKMWDKKGLSRISKNAKQDQGVAIDIIAPNYKNVDEILETYPDGFRLMALDGIENPQNLGMIIRSCAAGDIDGIILPSEGSAKISPLVVKASAGTLFKIDIFFCKTMVPILDALEVAGAEINMLSSHTRQDLHDYKRQDKEVFVLGNESEGVSSEVEMMCTNRLRIPMKRDVESLNVAVTAGIIAFLP